MATMAAAGERVRDVKNHLLFEIATEVAHRGKTVNGLSSCRASSLYRTDLPACSGSWWYLLRPQVQGAGDDG